MKTKEITVFITAIVLTLAVIASVFALALAGGAQHEQDVPDYVDVQLISLFGAARSGRALEEVRGIVVHYVGNPGTSAQANRNYFANPTTVVCSHFVIGLNGEVIQCVPLDERSAASNDRNRDTISIEVCHPDESGKFNDVTYDSLVRLTAWLCCEFDLQTDDVIRHYDVTGKMCPLYFVLHEDAWESFKADVSLEIGSLMQKSEERT
ncbi:MAG: N-acetylmuramoyl-L-alanine amidase [Clostridia bacterium]|nr:N-acetylmuramoyl-L-alanine amidase [Clostridia bacterium]